MIDRAKAAGIPVAALVGAKEHAVKQVRAGGDVIVAQGTEAGGHCGEVTTMVLIPEVIEAIRPIREVPVLAAGGDRHGEAAGRGGGTRRRRRVDRLRVADDSGSRDRAVDRAEHAAGVLPRHRAIEGADRQALPAARIGVDAGMGRRR